MRRTVFNVYAVVAFTFALLFATGCAVFRAYWEWSSYYAYVSENRVFPKKPRFKVLPKHIDALSPLRTDGVYYMWMHWPPDTPNPDCQYMRFWPDGRGLGWFVTARFPTTWDAESFNRVRMGFYHS